ncbi:hypothetical protein EYF80_015772 [Liparis tanakae]|uniref:Uncharacterized protein n=1 Tax=Liparis tanakae TaxID=230148 RepID=A0A4Z2I981_9TELE|nr:hypothetical protein EYF80_015772 [Liparis tanakae]
MARNGWLRTLAGTVRCSASMSSMLFSRDTNSLRSAFSACMSPPSGLSTTFTWRTEERETSPNRVAQTSRPCGKIAARGQEQFPDSLGSDEREVDFTPHMTDFPRAARSPRRQHIRVQLHHELSVGFWMVAEQRPKNLRR